MLEFHPYHRNNCPKNTSEFISHIDGHLVNDHDLHDIQIGFKPSFSVVIACVLEIYQHFYGMLYAFSKL